MPSGRGISHSAHCRLVPPRVRRDVPGSDHHRVRVWRALGWVLRPPATVPAVVAVYGPTRCRTRHPSERVEPMTDSRTTTEPAGMPAEHRTSVQSERSAADTRSATPTTAHANEDMAVRHERAEELRRQKF